MRVAQVWRYPVKSLQGERPAALEVGLERVAGDREWGVRDSATGVVLTGRTARPLLHAHARLAGPDDVVVTLPDGRELHETDDTIDLALSAYVGQPVHLAHAKSDERAAFEAPVELSDDTSPMAQWQSCPGSFNDGHPVHLLTTASLRAAGALHPDGEWDVRRFRPSVLLDVDGDEFAEDAWTAVTIGDVALEVYKRTTRCAITARAQPGLDDDLEVPRSLARNRNAKLGVYARVTTAGTIAPGDPVTVA
ncbi:MAG: uncharacterized protein QOD30_2552 [Actinomycetota bacterium]|jgi:uncharacterized protein YcbX|nr:uncharacterized protein [Actinomycetota bacterium]